jgi:hypothetical protein
LGYGVCRKSKFPYNFLCLIKHQIRNGKNKTFGELVKNFEERYKAVLSEYPDIEFLAKLACNETP